METIQSHFFEMGAFLADPETGLITIGSGGRVEKTHRLDKTPAFYLKDFFEDSYLAYYPQKWQKLERQEFIRILKSFSRSKSPITESMTSDEIYAKDFKLLKTCFNHHLKKVVLTSREEFKVSNPFEAKITYMIKALEFGVGLPYGLWGQEYGVVGSTPETLYSLKDSYLHTFALAGTAREGLDEVLIKSTKDRVEHDLVVRDLHEKLLPFCTEVEHDQTRLVKYKNMIHLKTDIKARLKDGVDFTKLTSSLSPTAALGGYPKHESLAFLKSTEYFKRFPKRYFGSALGLMTSEMKQFVVSIRNIQWEKDLFYIESGGGVLPESELENELAEINLKRQTIKGHYL